MKKRKTVNTKGKWLIVLLLLFSISNLTLLSQSKNVGIGTETPHGSALLDLDVSDADFTTKMGLLIPRVALTGTDDNTTISSPAQSLLIYNTATAGTDPNNVVPGFYYWDGTAWIKLSTITEKANANQLQGNDISTTNPTDGQFLKFEDGEWKPANALASVGLTMPANEFDVSDSPVTEDGTIEVKWKEQNPGKIFSTSWSYGGIPVFRDLTLEFIPALPASKITSGVFPVARGGTGATTLTGILKGNGADDPFTGITAAAGQVTFWSDENTISGSDNLTWDNENSIFKVDGKLTVTGEIDPISLTLDPREEAPEAAEGKIYYSSTDKGLKVYNGETWVALGSGDGAGGAELPSGTENQTLRYGSSGWVASSALINTGTQVGVNGELSVTGSISANGSLIYPPTTVESGENAVPTGKTYIKLNFTGDFTLVDGTTAGQVIILQKISSETATLENSDNCKITGNWVGSEYDTIQLIWDGGFWVEISRSNNVVE